MSVFPIEKSDRRGERVTNRKLTIPALALCAVFLTAAAMPLLRTEPAVPEEPARPLSDLRLIAHRGYTAAAPENTLSAFLAAEAAGYPCVETDIRFTRDGCPVLIHNPTVDDTSNGSGAVVEMTLEELQALDFGSWYGPEFAGERIPTLYEGLELCRQLGLEMYLELKVPHMTAEQFQSVAHAVEDSGMRERVTFSSFYLGCLRGVAEWDSGCAFQFLTPGGVGDMGELLRAIDYLQSLRETARGLSIGWEYQHLMSEMARMAARSGLTLDAWTIDDPEALSALPSVVSGVITNRITPEELSRLDGLEL